MLRVFAIAIGLLAGLPAIGAEMGGVTMPETQSAAGSTLVLNGMALRTYSFLRLRIYVAGLYLEHRSADPEAILNSPGPKLLHFTFLRDVAQWQSRRSWRDSFDASCRAPCHLPDESVARFMAAIPAVHAGDSSVFLFTNGGLDISMNGRVLGHVGDPQFVRVVLATFIGDHPTALDVKRELLGVAS